MMMEERMVIWPANMDVKKSRREGRIIPKRFAVRSPKIEEMEEVANTLGLNPEIKPEKAYPRSWWEKNGMLIVDKTVPKGKVVKEISQKIKVLREEQS
jgi:signal recognition particle subunit SRP19